MFLISDVSESLGISRYEVPEELSKKNGSPQNPEYAGKSIRGKSNICGKILIYQKFTNMPAISKLSESKHPK